MRQRAIVIYRDTAGVHEERLGRMLTFFGVSWKALGLSDLATGQRTPGAKRYVVFGSAETVCAALKVSSAAAVLLDATAVYVYGSPGIGDVRALSSLTGTEWVGQPFSNELVAVRVSSDCPELTGPMSGLDVTMRLRGTAPVAIGPRLGGEALHAIVAVNEATAFGRLLHCGVPVYVNGGGVVDIDEPVGRNSYDVKDHFLSAVPLVMFITWAFRDVMWRARETGACLIIDDPLLKDRYGFCDFRWLNDLMKQQGFTTNIAFIPWNWRRTTRAGSELFRRSDSFSISIHGCDHVAAEFGAASPETIEDRVRLAQERMSKHQQRTQIRHEPIMVFPQGVFSSDCPGVLKRNGLVAAVNTEISPADRDRGNTSIRDVWDIAIMRYGSFPIFTRRYANHGVENFAFDLLLGKPCFVVAHHEFFKDGGATLTNLISRLTELNGDLRWRSPLEVIRRACRFRMTQAGDEYEMYGSELMLASPSGPPLGTFIRKKERNPGEISEVRCNGGTVAWKHDGDYVCFQADPSAAGETLVTVHYKRQPSARRRGRSLTFELGVAARRVLSEVRDEFVQKLPSWPSTRGSETAASAEKVN